MSTLMVSEGNGVIADDCGPNSEGPMQEHMLWNPVARLTMLEEIDNLKLFGLSTSWLIIE